MNLLRSMYERALSISGRAAIPPAPYVPNPRPGGVVYMNPIGEGLWHYFDKQQPDWEGYYW